MNKGHEFFSGQYMKDMKDYPVLSSLETSILFEKYHNGDENAKQYLILCNLRLVVWQAKSFYHRDSHMKIMDLVQEGNIGLIKAVENYDSRKGEFSTFAVSYINGYIKKSLTKNFGVKATHRVFWRFKKYEKLTEEILGEQKELPNDQELCHLLSFSLKQLEEVKKMEKAFLYDQNIKDPILEDLTYTHHFISHSEYEFFVGLKNILSPLFYYVFYFRYLVSPRLTLKELSEHLGFSKPYVSQIETKGLEILKLYMKNDQNFFDERIKKIRLKEKGLINRININPILPEDIVTYIYVKPVLSELECQLFKLIYFNNYHYDANQVAMLLQLSIDEYQKLYHDLMFKISINLNDQEDFQQFRKKLLAKYKTKIFELDLDGDYSFLFNDQLQRKVILN
jgi:RNA polymerase primary sigma factor